MKKKINILIIIGLFLGIVGAIFVPEVMKKISFLGEIYVSLLKFIIGPLLLVTIIITINKSFNSKNKILLKTVITFATMFIISFLLTSLIVVLIKPGNGYIIKDIIWNGTVTEFSIGQIIKNAFPTDIVTMFQNNNIFSIFIFAIVCGYASSKIGAGESRLINNLNDIKDLLNKLLEYIMYLTPIGVFSLIGNSIANFGISFISLGIKYIAVAYLSSLIVIILVMIIPVWIVAKINPIKYLKKISKIWLVTFTTCSSSATLPYTIKLCNEELDIPENITNLVVPLGCTIHMCGGAVSFALLGLFCSQMLGIEVSLTTYLVMIISATLINMAAPGIPNGGIVIGATYLTILNIPLSFIGLYSGMYKILDMSYTTLNVTGDITANVLLNHYINKKN